MNNCCADETRNKLQRSNGDSVKRQSFATETSFIPPQVDMISREDGIVLVAAMPGVDESSVDIHVEKNTLTIAARPRDVEADGKTLLFREYQPLSFKRNFTLSDEVDTGGIKAKLKDGLLNVFLPRSENSKPRRIEVRLEE